MSEIAAGSAYRQRCPERRSDRVGCEWFRRCQRRPHFDQQGI